MNVFHQDRFQGNLKKKKYFEGYYFKNVNSAYSGAIACIPGVSLNPGDSHAFIQILNGFSGKSHYIRFDLSDFYFDKKNMFICIGENQFSKDYLYLDIHTDEINISGGLDYTEHVNFPVSPVSPGIMGWYSYLPFMQCNHAIISVDTIANGRLEIDGHEFLFENEKSYIEKDWGTSFPDAWIWLQCNSFTTISTSLFISIAHIPFPVGDFTGLISFLYHNNKFYTFATYTNSSFKIDIIDADTVSIILTNSHHKLHVKISFEDGKRLIAPVSGGMNRDIKESLNSSVVYTLYDAQGKIVVSDSGIYAGVELTDVHKLIEAYAKKND